VLLPHAPSSVAVARQRLCAQLLASGVADPIVADAAVIVSELLSNALRHARPLPSGEVRVAWNRHGGVIEVSVSDGGASTEPRRGRHTPSSLGGRGLGIVESLAECWGVRHEDGAVTVWALLRASTSRGSDQPFAAGSPISVKAPINPR
jgi:anti-sigma regulatory factor (Ser/Thr protein kinase)